MSREETKLAINLALWNGIPYKQCYLHTHHLECGTPKDIPSGQFLNQPTDIRLARLCCNGNSQKPIHVSGSNRVNEFKHALLEGG